MLKRKPFGTKNRIDLKYAKFKQLELFQEKAKEKLEF